MKVVREAKTDVKQPQEQVRSEKLCRHMYKDAHCIYLRFHLYVS